VLADTMNPAISTITINHHGSKVINQNPLRTKTINSIKQPPNIFSSYLHLYYMKSRSKNQPNLKLNLKIILKIGLFLF